MATKRERYRAPTKAANMVAILPGPVVATIFPYPTLVMVINTYQMEFWIVSKSAVSYSENTNA